MYYAFVATKSADLLNCNKANQTTRHDFQEICKALFDFKKVLRLTSFLFSFSRNNSLSGNSHVTFWSQFKSPIYYNGSFLESN